MPTQTQLALQHMKWVPVTAGQAYDDGITAAAPLQPAVEVCGCTFETSAS